MTTKRLYNILDKYDLYDGDVRLTVDGKAVRGVTVKIGDDVEDYYAATVDLQTEEGEE